MITPGGKPGTMLRSQIMAAMADGRRFDIAFVMCDRRRGSAGKVKRVKQWAMLKWEDVQQLPGRMIRKTDITRETEHWKNKTFIIYNPDRMSQHPITVHYRFVLELNGQRIING